MLIVLQLELKLLGVEAHDFIHVPAASCHQAITIAKEFVDHLGGGTILF